MSYYDFKQGSYELGIYREDSVVELDLSRIGEDFNSSSFLGILIPLHEVHRLIAALQNTANLIRAENPYYFAQKAIEK